MSGSFSVFARELKLAWSGGGGAALPVGFFAAAASMTPFAVGNEIGNLQIAGPGVMWIALALASLLPMERLFQADLEDGTLDAYAGSGVGMEGIALAKTLAHWIATGIPLAFIAPILWIMLQGPPEQVLFVIGAALVGSLAFFFFGSIGAALAAGLRRGGLVIALVTALCLRLAGPIGRALGPTGINVMTRLMGLILAALAVEVMADGLQSLFPLLASKGGR
jgi:heme exporter protein B